MSESESQIRCRECGSLNPQTNQYCDFCAEPISVLSCAPQADSASPGSESAADSPLSALFTQVRLEQLLWFLVFIVAIVLRFYALGERPLHHDESLHALYSWKLFRGEGYEYDPMMHGPFLFHANALVYLLFGDSDFTCRLLPALMSVFCIYMAYVLRPYMGRAGAAFLGLILALSPSFTYFGRFIRNDIYIAAFSLIMVYGAFRYLETRKARFLYLVSAGLSLSFSTKEVIYIIGLIFAGFVLARWVWEKLAKQDQSRELISCVIHMLRHPAQIVLSLVVFFVIAGSLYTTMMSHPRGFIDAFTKSWSYWMGQHKVQRGSQPVHFYLTLIIFYETLSFLLSVAASLYYSFFRDPAYRLGKIVGYAVVLFSWYYFARHGEDSGGLVVACLLVLAGTGLLAYFSFFGLNNFLVFLLVWCWSSLSDFSFAGERMPWLVLHPLLPMTMLSAYFLGDLWQRLPARRSWIVGVFCLFSLVMFRNNLAATFGDKGANPVEQLVYVQSANDVTDVAARIVDMSQKMTGVLDMHIHVEDYTTWPFAWYLRWFRFVGYPRFKLTDKEEDIVKHPVILSGIEIADTGHDDHVAKLLASNYVSHRYRLRVWWSPDWDAFFKDSLLGKISKVWRLFAYREPWNPIGSYDMMVFIRRDVEHLYWGYRPERM